MNCRAIDISNFFIGKGVSHLKLQKLLYYSQLWYFVKEQTFLFDDTIKAWMYGPVVETVWHRFKYTKKNNLIPKSRIVKTDFANLNEHLNQVWDAYGHLSGAELMELTHSEAPWNDARKGLLNSEPGNVQIEVNNRTTQSFVLCNGKIPYKPNFSAFGKFESSEIVE